MASQVQIDFLMREEHVEALCGPGQYAQYVAKMLRMIAERIEKSPQGFNINARNEEGQRVTIGGVTLPYVIAEPTPILRYTANEKPDFEIALGDDIRECHFRAYQFFGFGPLDGDFEATYWNDKEFIWRPA